MLETKRYRKMSMEIKLPSEKTGEELFEEAREKLDVYGGWSHSISRDDDLNVMVQFDPRTATGGLAAVVGWLDSTGLDYEFTVSSWFDDD